MQKYFLQITDPKQEQTLYESPFILFGASYYAHCSFHQEKFSCSWQHTKYYTFHLINIYLNGNRNMKSARKQRIQRYFRIKLLKYYRAIKVKKGEQSQKNTPTANINTLLWDNQNHLILKFSKLDVVAIQITLS